MPENKDFFTSRIAELIDRLGDIGRAAEAVGKTPRQIRRYYDGLQHPPFSVIEKLAKQANIPVNEVFLPKASKSNDGFVSIPVMDVEASAGNGSPVEHEGVSDLMRLNEVWLRQTFHVTPNSVTILPVKGDSMEPTIRSGELVLIEKIDPAVRPGDGIYIVRLDGTVAVKRLQSLPGGVIRVSSDNKNFTPYDVGPDDTVDFAVLGRVLAGLRAI